MRTWRTKFAILMVALGGALDAPAAHAITIQLDYSYDSNNFFGSGNPQGAAAGALARSSLEAAADYLSDILTDTFSRIQTPAPYHSQTFSGEVVWSWSLNFSNPSNNGTVTLNNRTIAANRYVMYAGAKDLPGSTLGQGGPGGWGWNQQVPVQGFTTAELDEINDISVDFQDAVENRGEPDGDFSNWGGAITFDSQANWHFNHETQPSSGKNDFYSVALHELVHALGFGNYNTDDEFDTEWEGLVSGSRFVGSNASSLYGGSIPLSSDRGHWANGTSSTVFGVGAPQEAAMDPDLTQGSRKLLTALDAAALRDIGWETRAPAGLDGDYNFDGIVDAADYTVWRDSLGSTSNLVADGSGNGRVDSADFVVWRNAFGDTQSGSLQVSSTVVPEPSSSVIVALLAGVFLLATSASRTLCPVGADRRLGL